MRYGLMAFTCAANEIAATLNAEHVKSGMVVVTVLEIEKVQVISPSPGPSTYNCAFLVSYPDEQSTG